MCSQFVTDARHKIYVTAQIFISNVIVMHKDREIYVVSSSSRRSVLSTNAHFEYVIGFPIYARGHSVRKSKRAKVCLCMCCVHCSAATSPISWCCYCCCCYLQSIHNKSKHIKCDTHLDRLNVINASASRIYVTEIGIFYRRWDENTCPHCMLRVFVSYWMLGMCELACWLQIRSFYGTFF